MKKHQKLAFATFCEAILLLRSFTAQHFHVTKVLQDNVGHYRTSHFHLQRAVLAFQPTMGNYNEIEGS